MNLSNFVAYVKQAWKNKPDTSTPLSAERLTHQEEGIKGNSDAIQELAAAVVSQIVNNPDKIASMAALYAVNQKVTTLDGKVGDTAQLPSGTADVASAIAQLYSNIASTANAKSINVSSANVDTIVKTIHKSYDLNNPTVVKVTGSGVRLVIGYNYGKSSEYGAYLLISLFSELYLMVVNKNTWRKYQINKTEETISS